ncbi:MarR family transcriptional regulator [Streptomyces sp. NPDC091289]|uniref:MarR family transcriptional regulator n=1 Tax=Streptomyces sp. NPDC091289 TaxID=3365989 RepID=UPI0037FB26F8
MATQHTSPALHAPASSPAYPRATPGYGKRSAPGQLPRRVDDFALLPARERYVAGFVDHLPDGAAMSVKTLAKQLPLYGQQAIGTALTALSVAGHLRRVRCAVGQGETTRWAFRTFWSRTARDNEWWNTYLAAEKQRLNGADSPDSLSQEPGTGSIAPPPPWVPAEELVPRPPVREAPPESAPAPPPGEASESSPAPLPGEASASSPAPPPGKAPEPDDLASRPDATPSNAPADPVQPPNAPPPDPGNRPSPAFLALAELGRRDLRVALSATDCATLEPLAAAWLDRGVTTDYLVHTLTAGLPHPVDSPIGLIRRRLTDKIPPQLPTEPTPPPPDAPTHRVMMECTNCRAPGRPEALPDGLCRPCRTEHASGSAGEAVDTRDAPDIGAYVAELRDLLKAP